MEHKCQCDSCVFCLKTLSNGLKKKQGAANDPSEDEDEDEEEDRLNRKQL